MSVELPVDRSYLIGENEHHATAASFDLPQGQVLGDQEPAQLARLREKHTGLGGYRPCDPTETDAGCGAAIVAESRRISVQCAVGSEDTFFECSRVLLDQIVGTVVSIQPSA